MRRLVSSRKGRIARCAPRYGVKGQVWVETVIYTLIGLTIIGLVLAGAQPRIADYRSRLAIEQATSALEQINAKIYDVQRATGNQRRVDVKVGSGRLQIDPSEDTISWILESSYAFSEPGLPITLGAINVTTTGTGKPYDVELLMTYPVDIRFEGEEIVLEELSVAPTPYILIIENQGVEDGDIVIDIREGG